MNQKPSEQLDEVMKELRKEKEKKLAGFFLKISKEEVRLFGIRIFKRKRNEA